MQLVLIGKGQWTVYAVCSDENTCPLLDLVDELDEKRGAKVMSDLKELVPNSSQADWARIHFSWPLRGCDGIFEFRWSTRGGGTPRVFWFFDKGHILVCSHGLNKKGNSIDRREIEIAEAARAQYLQAKETGRLKVVALEQFVRPD
ncbi:MAG: type II toxin-antitoxin system RelE/ParE family toxin [Steroidobacteraceae bacterium]